MLSPFLVRGAREGDNERRRMRHIRSPARRIHDSMDRTREAATSLASNSKSLRRRQRQESPGRRRRRRKKVSPIDAPLGAVTNELDTRRLKTNTRHPPKWLDGVAAPALIKKRRRTPAAWLVARFGHPLFGFRARQLHLEKLLTLKQDTRCKTWQRHSSVIWKEKKNLTSSKWLYLIQPSPSKFCQGRKIHKMT